MSEQVSIRRLYGRLLTYVKPFIGSFLVAILGFVLFASAAPALSWMMGQITEVLANPKPEDAHFVIVTLIVIFAYRGLGTFLGKYFIARVGRGVVHSLRTVLFNHMLTLPSNYYDGESTGRLISRVIFDVDQVTGAATKALTTLVQDGLTVIFLMGYLIYLDWTLTLIFLALAPIIGALVSFASKFFRKYSKRIQQSVGNVTQVTNESITAYREVRTFGGQDFESARFNKASEDNRKQALKFALTNAINVPLNQQIIALGLGVMIYMMFERVLNQSMSAGEFMTFITAASLIAKPLRALTDINSVVQKGMVGAESIFTVLDSEGEKDEGHFDLVNARGDVEINNLSFKYPSSDDWVLKSLNATAKAGKSYALVGRSGGGKTTLMTLLPRFYQAQQGSILLDGHKIEDLTLASLRKNVSVVSQQVMLFNSTVLENIAYGELKGKTREEVITAAKAAHADEFIVQMSHGYDTIIGDNGVLLSGGQRQRIAIARAILKNSPVLILDEATSALDTESERHIQSAMEEVMKGRTTFVIAHRLSTIENADQIWVMEKGEIIERGTHGELLAAKGAYANLHDMQFHENENA
ncbi:Lipid A export ATP-binding/permease protein MsbA [Oleispira antarctica RB-8]|uniref:Lipid A export ATP-binding/permease protein MsbA n=1 Tax=Oleispira antarctica RB-8 TaxID=698738 RepID=R4YMW2_OLEAN|nr:Lipid A export ATP-binding/permease protein MsbA [Oleispira antarctica RB-8]